MTDDCYFINPTVLVGKDGLMLNNARLFLPELSLAKFAAAVLLVIEIILTEQLVATLL